MAERQHRQRLGALRNNRQLARFVVEGKATGKQLGTGSYGSVEEVWMILGNSLSLPNDSIFSDRSKWFDMCWKEDP